MTSRHQQPTHGQDTLVFISFIEPSFLFYQLSTLPVFAFCKWKPIIFVFIIIAILKYYWSVLQYIKFTISGHIIMPGNGWRKCHIFLRKVIVGHTHQYKFFHKAAYNEFSLMLVQWPLTALLLTTTSLKCAIQEYILIFSNFLSYIDTMKWSQWKVKYLNI